MKRGNLQLKETSQVITPSIRSRINPNWLSGLKGSEWSGLCPSRPHLLPFSPSLTLLWPHGLLAVPQMEQGAYSEPLLFLFPPPGMLFLLQLSAWPAPSLHSNVTSSEKPSLIPLCNHAALITGHHHSGLLCLPSVTVLVTIWNDHFTCLFANRLSSGLECKLPESGN